MKSVRFLPALDGGQCRRVLASGANGRVAKSGPTPAGVRLWQANAPEEYPDGVGSRQESPYRSSCWATTDAVGLGPGPPGHWRGLCRVRSSAVAQRNERVLCEESDSRLSVSSAGYTGEDKERRKGT